VYAIYHSPLAFIRILLEIGANPNTPVDDGFPPLIAALSGAGDLSGATRRTDVDDICCRLARTRINAVSMTTRHSTWPSPSVIR
jgi:hypothetical protein